MRFVACLTIFITAAVATGNAQQSPSFQPRRFIVSGGMSAASGYPVGDLTATIPRNSAGTPPPFTLLRAESEFDRAIGFEARVAYALTRAFAVEVGGAFSSPQLGVTITQDPELTGEAFASEQVDQYLVDFSGVYQLPYRLGSRARTYVIGGGGYLRQLHEGELLVETGGTVHAGGGLQYWFRGGGRVGRGLGARGEARYVWRIGGVDFEDRSRGFPAISVLGFVAF